MYLYCLDQAEDLFGGVGQVLAGGFRGHGFFQGGYGVEDGGRRRQCRAGCRGWLQEWRSRRKQGLFCCIFLRWRRHRWGLFHDGLAIEAAFTGDHDVSIFDAGFQSGFFQDDLDAGLEDGICVGKEGETESTGGSGARVVRSAFGYFSRVMLA